MKKPVRHLFNTSGEYVAFLSEGYLFAPDTTWLGVVGKEQEVYNTRGIHIGFLRADDRVVRLCANTAVKQILQPRQPMRPVQPIPPRRRLFMPAVSFPFEDIFEGAGRHVRVLLSWERLQELETLEGCSLVAQDGTFLGIISRDRTADQSLANLGGPYGNAVAEVSIFNARGRYGGEDSTLSPFNPAAPSPPQIEREGARVGYLSNNPSISGRLDPLELLAWILWRPLEPR